jgi:hypothetical protein
MKVEIRICEDEVYPNYFLFKKDDTRGRLVFIDKDKLTEYEKIIDDYIKMQSELAVIYDEAKYE